MLGINGDGSSCRFVLLNPDDRRNVEGSQSHKCSRWLLQHPHFYSGNILTVVLEERSHNWGKSTSENEFWPCAILVCWESRLHCLMKCARIHVGKFLKEYRSLSFIITMPDTACPPLWYRCFTFVCITIRSGACATVVSRQCCCSWINRALSRHTKSRATIWWHIRLEWDCSSRDKQLGVKVQERARLCRGRILVKPVFYFTLHATAPLWKSPDEMAV